MLLLQLAVPQLRTGAALRNLNLELASAGYDLNKWRCALGVPELRSDNLNCNENGAVRNLTLELAPASYHKWRCASLRSDGYLLACAPTRVVQYAPATCAQVPQLVLRGSSHTLPFAPFDPLLWHVHTGTATAARSAGQGRTTSRSWIAMAALGGTWPAS